MRFSPSSLKTWGSCSLQARFSYIDKLPRRTGSSAHFGTCVHSALECLSKGGSLDEALKTFLVEYDSLTPDYYNRQTSYNGLREKGQQMIKEYADTRKWDESKIVASEHHFMVDIGEHQLSGIVDLMETPNDLSCLTLVDFKTGYRPKKDILHLDLQWTAYCFGSLQKTFWTGHPDNIEKYKPLPNGEELWEIFKDKPRKLTWYDVKKNEEIDVGPRTDRDFGRMYRCMEQIARAVELEVFVPTVSGDTCVFCDHQDVCPVSWKKDD